MRQLVSDPGGDLAIALRRLHQGEPPVSWEQQSPDSRSLSPGDTPREVLAGLHHVWLELSMPAPWQEIPAVLCTKSRLGWNECIPLKSGGEFMAYAVPGEDLEVWLLDANATTTAPVARLGVIPTGAIEAATRAENRKMQLLLTGGEGASNLGALLSEANQGHIDVGVLQP